MRKLILPIVGLALLMMVQGCGPCGIVETANTLGAGLNIGDLTACQWVTLFNDGPRYAAMFGVAIPVNLPTLSEAQAQDIVDFLDAHNITTVDELKAQIEANTISESELPQSLLDFYNEFKAENPDL